MVLSLCFFVFWGKFQEMLGIVFLYFIGKAFYDLAVLHEKNKWLFALLGVAFYYVGTFVGGFTIAISYELFEFGSVDDLNDQALGLMAIPFGLLFCWVFYIILKRQWSRTHVPSDLELLDDDLEA